MPKEMTKVAIIGALSDKAETKKLVVLEESKKMTGKTAEVKEAWKKITAEKESLLVIVDSAQKELLHAWRNLSKTEVATSESVNAYTVIKYNIVAITKEAIQALEKKYVN